MIVESWDLFFSSYFPQPYGKERERKWTAADRYTCTFTSCLATAFQRGKSEELKAFFKTKQKTHSSD